MRIDDILEVHDGLIINENKSYIIQVLNTLKNMTWGKSQDFLRGKVKEFFNAIDDNDDIDRQDVLSVVNKHLWSNFRSITPITNKRITESYLNEGIFDSWWKEATGNLYGALSFYPLLTAFLEMDKVIKGSGDANIRAMSIYFIIWIAIITGKVVSGRLVSKNTKAPKASLHPSQVGK